MSRNPESISVEFGANVDSVYALMNFDRVVMDFAIQNVQSLHDRLAQTAVGDRPWLNAEHTLSALRMVRENDSLRSKYQTIFNQCDVLLVSYFAAAVQDIFKACLADRVREMEDAQLLKQEVKVTFADFKETNFNLLDRFPDLVIDSRNISFQDMGSIVRAWGDLLGCEPPRTGAVNDIIAAQACRNAIVHAGGIVDRRLIRQVRNATPRQVQPRLEEGLRIQFTPDEVMQAGEAMRAYVAGLVSTVAKANPNPTR